MILLILIILRSWQEDYIFYSKYYLAALLSSLDCPGGLNDSEVRPWGSSHLQILAFSKSGCVVPIGFYTSVFICNYVKCSEFIPDDV